MAGFQTLPQPGTYNPIFYKFGPDFQWEHSTLSLTSPLNAHLRRKER